jgi:hypothetical protein
MVATTDGELHCRPECKRFIPDKQGAAGNDPKQSYNINVNSRKIATELLQAKGRTFSSVALSVFGWGELLFPIDLPLPPLYNHSHE